MRILFLTPRFPYPPLKGDTLRTYHQIRTLARRHSVTLLSLSDAPVSMADLQHMEAICERVEIVPLPRPHAILNLGLGLLSPLPLQVSYYRSPLYKQKLNELLTACNFDVVHATLIRMLPYVWRLRRPPVVVDLIDSLTLNLKDRRGKIRGPLRLAYELEYRRVRRYEQEVVRRFPNLVVSSPADKEALGGGSVTVIPNGVDVDKFAFVGQEERDPAGVIFTGNMGYHPNEEAVVWFAREVWPLVSATRPDARFQVVGTDPTERVRLLQDGATSIEVLGKVPDVASCLGRAAVSVAPMHTGSGIQNKVLEAMSTGTPVVATSTANRGVGGTPGRDLLLADSAPDFAAAVVCLLNDSGLREKLAEGGRALVEGRFRWEKHAEQLAEVYKTAIRRRTRPGAGRPAKLNVWQMTDVTGRGGAEKALVDLALRLDPSRYNITVCATRTAGNYQPMLDEAEVRTIVLERGSRRQSYKMLKLLWLMRRQPVHILHTHLFGANTWGRALGRLAGVPVVIAHEHWSSKSAREVLVDRLLYRLTSRILVPSEASKRLVMEVEHIPARYLDVAYNGVDVSRFAPGVMPGVRAELGIAPNEFVVGTVGRLSADKGGQDTLLRAVAELRQSRPQVRLLVVGDGPLRPELEGLAQELGMLEAGHALFTGTRADVARLLSAMDLFVLPSLHEALPIAVLEAMAVCLPVVATRVGGVPEVVKDGVTGMLVPPGDTAALVNALSRLITDRDLAERMGREGQARVQAHFTVEKMVAHVEQLYERLWSETKSASGKHN